MVLEVFYEKKIVNIVDEVLKYKDVKIILIVGFFLFGKIIFVNRLSV